MEMLNEATRLEEDSLVVVEDVSGCKSMYLFYGISFFFKSEKEKSEKNKFSDW
jgi:hypothetical protein